MERVGVEEIIAVVGDERCTGVAIKQPEVAVPGGPAKRATGSDFDGLMRSSSQGDDDGREGTGVYAIFRIERVFSVEYCADAPDGVGRDRKRVDRATPETLSVYSGTGDSVVPLFFGARLGERNSEAVSKAQHEK